MKKELLMEHYAGQTRLALIEDGLLSELYVERPGGEKLLGNIYAGRVLNVLPGMQAAFVDIGLEKNGFLYAGDIGIDKRTIGPDAGALEQASMRSIGQLLRPGQQVLVQVAKERVGDKGPRLSGNITLPGRMVVLLPTLTYVGVSRRIESDEERSRLRALAERIKPEGMGLIVRTAAENADEAAFVQDIEYLMGLWETIEQAARYTAPPALLHRDLSLSHRAVRDMLLADVDALWVDGARLHRLICAHAALLGEALLGKVRLYEGDGALFDAYTVDAHLEKALSRRVWLRSGGYLVIDYTEALTVIDVNTGKYVGKRSLSETVFSINCEAATEIARQLRLRDIGGIVVIDFIDMDDEKHRETLLEHFREALKRDRTKTNLVGITGLGLVEMTRKKVHQPLKAVLGTFCPACQGAGFVLGPETVARDALIELRRCMRGDGAWLIEADERTAEEILAIGGPRAHAYVCAMPHLTRTGYKVKPILEHELPRGARPLAVSDENP